MPQKIDLPGGAIEYIDTAEEKESKEKRKAKKKPADLSDADIKELVYTIAKKLNLI